MTRSGNMTIEEALVAELRTMKGSGCPKAARATTDCLRSAITGTKAAGHDVAAHAAAECGGAAARGDG
jgi:hypothetical protein